MSCCIQSVASRDLMIEFWSPTLDEQTTLPEQFVNAGDTVTFTVYGPHTVFIHPTLTCDPTNRNELVPKDNTVTYTFQESDSGFYGNQMLFVCDAGSHCEQGQQISFRVFPTPEPPSPAPSLRPSANTDLTVPNESNTADIGVGSNNAAPLPGGAADAASAGGATYSEKSSSSASVKSFFGMALALVAITTITTGTSILL
eukprot:CAMPEP_0113655132 /NCGR_PEP_ID=MMETSP0017_2-20120614/29530_1 /TAXON_ID=2856 /ORGANISM="Cylindrotheca closterium" /LENGTH=199 /DNA_ID=CAMNT_0000568333 /DNA_START=134 /DNA_END=733 /DNA_ORIENTATION=- /assembly_acc=CAM_ASM_000147